MAAAHAGRTGRFRVTAAPVWMQAVVAPAVRAFHAAFPEVELKHRTAAWREGARLLVDGRSDLHCGGIDTGEALPAHLRRKCFLDVTAGIVASNGRGPSAVPYWLGRASQSNGSTFGSFSHCTASSFRNFSLASSKDILSLGQVPGSISKNFLWPAMRGGGATR